MGQVEFRGLPRPGGRWGRNRACAGGAEHMHNRRWDDKPESCREACYENRRRVARKKGKALQPRRSDFVEHTLAHVCATRRRRSWIRGIVEVGKRYQMQVAAHNLEVILRKLFGVGTPRGWGPLRTRCGTSLAPSDSWIESGSRSVAACRFSCEVNTVPPDSIPRNSNSPPLQRAARVLAMRKPRQLRRLIA